MALRQIDRRIRRTERDQNGVQRGKVDPEAKGNRLQIEGLSTAANEVLGRHGQSLGERTKVPEDVFHCRHSGAHNEIPAGLLAGEQHRERPNET